MVNRKCRGRAGRAAMLGLALVAGALGLAGCAARVEPPPPVPVTVKVPVPEPVYCPAPDTAKPALPIARLSPDSSPADTMRAYAASVVLLKGAVEERDRILRGCTRPVSQASASDSAERKDKVRPRSNH